VGWGPDQSLSLGLAEAVQEVAFVLDQVNVTDCPSVTVLGDAESATVGAGGGGGLALPPPHPLRSNGPQTKLSIKNCFFMKPPPTCALSRLLAG
jgi:hypothetical protein